MRQSHKEKNRAKLSYVQESLPTEETIFLHYKKLYYKNNMHNMDKLLTSKRSRK